jgi:hypothetical protein
MGYEVFQRTNFRVEEPALSFTPDGRIALNAAAVRIFTEAGIKQALLLWDQSKNKLALKATVKRDKNSYSVSIIRGGTSGTLRAKAFFAYIGWNAPKRMMLPATWDDKERMFEVVLPSNFVNSPKR